MILNYDNKIAENLDAECWGRANTAHCLFPDFQWDIFDLGEDVESQQNYLGSHILQFVKYSSIILLIDLAHFLQTGPKFHKSQYRKQIQLWNT